MEEIHRYDLCACTETITRCTVIFEMCYKQKDRLKKPFLSARLFLSENERSFPQRSSVQIIEEIDLWVSIGYAPLGNGIPKDRKRMMPTR